MDYRENLTRFKAWLFSCQCWLDMTGSAKQWPDPAEQAGIGELFRGTAIVCPLMGFFWLRKSLDLCGFPL